MSEMSETLEKLLKNKFLYLNVPNLKELEIKFFLEKMKETLKKVDVSQKEEGKVTKRVSGEEFQQASLEISFYTSAFYSAVISFFDTIAIFHTKNRVEVYDKVHFYCWLQYQFERNPDDYIKLLKSEDEKWISKLRKNRNLFMHRLHVFNAIKHFQHLSWSADNKILKVENIVTELEEGKKELLPYCEEIYQNILKLEEKINKYINKEYEYQP
jgi:hypothetical protein